MYKMYALMLFALLPYGRLNAQSHIEENSNIATFIKVWGFLKYYHPTVAQGKIN